VAISATHFALLNELHSGGVLPKCPKILQVGSANWYGDIPPSVVSPELTNDSDPFDVVHRLYEVLLKTEDIHSIDLDPMAKGALRIDLNTYTGDLSECGCEGRFELSINHGTAEHIFNIANVFRVMHEATLPKGIMIHESPFTGWLDHGFYCLQPTLFYDLAAANSYDIVMMATERLESRSIDFYKSREHFSEAKRQGKLADNLMLFVVFKKTTDEPFKIPMQGVYSGALSQAGMQDWRELR